MILAGPGAARPALPAGPGRQPPPYHRIAAAAHATLVARPAPSAVVGRVLTAPLVGRGLAGGWSVFWNELLDGATPGSARSLAALATRLGGRLTARTEAARWFAATFGGRARSARRPVGGPALTLGGAGGRPPGHPSAGDPAPDPSTPHPLGHYTPSRGGGRGGGGSCHGDRQCRAGPHHGAATGRHHSGERPARPRSPGRRRRGTRGPDRSAARSRARREAPPHAGPGPATGPTPSAGARRRRPAGRADHRGRRARGTGARPAERRPLGRYRRLPGRRPRARAPWCHRRPKTGRPR